MSDWDSLDERSYDCLQQELTRLRAREAVLVDVLTDCQTVLCESRRGEDLKTLSDAELGHLWTSLETKVAKALATLDVEEKM